VPVPTDSKSGILLRSIGYTEKIPAIGRYNIDDDGAFTLITPYEGSSAEERIWFATKDVRLRVSMMRTQSGQVSSKLLFPLKFASTMEVEKKPTMAAKALSDTQAFQCLSTDCGSLPQ